MLSQLIKFALIAIVGMFTHSSNAVAFQDWLYPRIPSCFSGDSCISAMSKLVSTPLAQFCTTYDEGSTTVPAAAASVCSPLLSKVASVCSCATSTAVVSSASITTSSLSRPTSSPLPPPTSVQTTTTPPFSSIVSSMPQIPCAVTTVTQISFGKP
jgi:hypothetical protein